MFIVRWAGAIARLKRVVQSGGSYRRSDAPRKRRAAIMVAVSAILCSTLPLTPASAHDGHDHGVPTPGLPLSVEPRAVAVTDSYEVVAVLKGTELVIYIDRFADNTPVTSATVTATIGADQRRAKVAPDGTYRVAAPEFAKPGKHELILAIDEGTASDLVIATLDNAATHSSDGTADPTMPAGTAKPTDVASSPLANWLKSIPAGIQAAVGALAILLISAALVIRRGPRRVASPDNGTEPVADDKSHSARKTAALAIIGLLLFPVDPARAHGDEDHGEAKPAPVLAGSAPRRLPDASVFLPKASQRLLDVRTSLTANASTRPTLSFTGRVMANPDKSGVVQSASGGRLTPSPGGLPRLGQAVKAGDVLATITPAYLAIDATQVAQTAGDLDQQIELAKTKLARAQRLLSTGAGTRVQADETEVQVRGLEARRAALNASQVKTETLIAPVDGVIAGTKAVPGQVVAPQDILFEIVDASSFWVEAYSYDANGPQTFVSASASTQDGLTLPLKFIGRSRTLRQQATVLQFEVDGAQSALNVGMLVRVTTQAGEPVSAIVVPKSAVVRAANGEDIVWRHTDAERFVATPVKTAPFDGEHVRIESGLKPGERVVVRSAELINQVR